MAPDVLQPTLLLEVCDEGANLGLTVKILDGHHCCIGRHARNNLDAMGSHGLCKRFFIKPFPVQQREPRDKEVLPSGNQAKKQQYTPTSAPTLTSNAQPCS